MTNSIAGLVIARFRSQRRRGRVFLVAVLVASVCTLLVSGSSERPAAAQSETQIGVPATGNIRVKHGTNSGEVVISWDYVPDATHYRIGYVNLDQDYDRAVSNPAKDWKTAFVYVDEDARNLVVVGGRVEHTVRRLGQGDFHAFTVLSGGNVVNDVETLSGDYTWPQNPRWRRMTVADRGGACPGSSVDTSAAKSASASPQGVGTVASASRTVGVARPLNISATGGLVWGGGGRHDIQTVVAGAGANAGRTAQGSAPAVEDIRVVDGEIPGEVVISWDYVPGATHYRIGYVNLDQDYDRAVSNPAKDWKTAFVYVDEDARNLVVVGGRVEHTVRRLGQGDFHAFTVLSGGNVVNDVETLSGDYTWPQNPRWRRMTVADHGGACSDPAPVVPTPISLAGLLHGAWLEENKPALANRIKQLPWVADGVDDTERDSAETLIESARWWPETFNALMQEPWIRDAITRDEAKVIEQIYWLTRQYVDEPSRIRISEAVIALLDMPFLDSVESADSMAVWELQRIARANRGDFLEIMTHAKVKDGITNQEAKVVAVLSSAYRFKPASLAVLLDGLDGTGGVYLQERSIDLPHSGAVQLTIIRVLDQVTPSMDYLEHAVRNVEGFMGVPLPTNYVALYFDDATVAGGGYHADTHITSELNHDDVNHPYWQVTPRHIAHEVGHYYWKGDRNRWWLSEGAADLVSFISENIRIARPLEPDRGPCPYFDTISQLEMAVYDLGSPENSCNYSLGQRLFLDLYHALGDTEFRRGFRNLYLSAERGHPAGNCAGDRQGICHLEAAFKTGAPVEVAARVDEVVDRWYQGIGAAEPQIPGREDLYQAIQPPEHMAYIWWRWNSDQDHFRELVTDFTIHNDVGDFSDEHGLFLMLGVSDISDTQFYFGVQTDANRRGKAVIFSRWGTRNLANAKWDETFGWTESAGHEGDFIGVRRSYAWGAGTYRIRIASDGLESDGEWFGLWITDLATNETTWIGSLKFPLLNGAEQINPGSYSTLEIYGNPPIQPIDIPQWHVSIKRPVGDNVRAVRGLPGYSMFTGDALQNSEVRYDPSDDVVHLQVGGTTERKTPAIGWIDFKTLANLNDLERADRLEPTQANQLESLPWIADGIDDRERETAQMLVDAANHYPDTFKALLKKPWVTDHDLTDAEATAIYGIRWMARRDEASTLAILQMPFLQTLEFDDSLALLALHRLARYADDGRFETLLEHPELADGITDDLTTMVTAVGTIRDADEVERMLNPGYANIEVHVGQTTLTPELKISIVRTHSDGSPETMPELVRIAELLESTMQVPLPKPHLIFVISDQATSVPGSQGTRYDFAYGLRGDRENLQRFARQYATDRPMLPSVVIHEIGHDYYGSEIKSWLNHTPIKAGFEYIYRMDGRDRSDVPANVLNVIQRRDCTARNIQHLEEMNPSSSDRGNRLCHHYLGYWMGRELLEAVGQDEFMARMRRLYHLKNEMVAEGVDPGIAEVRELFSDQLEIVERYWSGDVGTPEERYWDGLASLAEHPMEHTFGCSCAGCMGTL